MTFPRLTARTPFSLAPSLALLVASALAPGCAAEHPTVLVLRVDRRPGVESPQKLKVTLSVEGSPIVREFKPDLGGPVQLPTDLVVRADGRSGQIVIAVEALNAASAVVGSASTGVALSPGSQAAALLRLEPPDFRVSANYEKPQLFSTTAAGRHIAADSSGSFVVVWEQDCPPNCGIFYRLFDGNAQPRLNSATGQKAETNANKDPGVYEQPAVAAMPSGNFVAAWRRDVPDTANPGKKLVQAYSRSFDASGAANPAVAGGAEVPLSGAGSDGMGTPDLVALSNQTYAVVWEHKSGPEAGGRIPWRLLAQRLDQNGQIIKAAGALTDAPIQLASFTSISAPRPAIAPTASGASAAGFVMVWRYDEGLRARTFAADLNPTADEVTVCAGDTQCVARAFDVGTVTNGFAVIWAESLKGACDPSNPTLECVKLRRLGLQGTSLEKAWALSTTSLGRPSDPTIARLTSDGSMLAVWSTTAAPGDQAAGIRGRRILANGLPVGAELQLNTTVRNNQLQPSVAPHGSDGFIVTFQDWSESSNDNVNDKALIRARLVYPVFDPRDGSIGALCDQGGGCGGAGGSALKCTSTQVGSRCVATCGATDKDKPCPHGGTCDPAQGACVY